MEPLRIVITTPAFDPSAPLADQACIDMMKQAAPDAVISDGSGLLLKELQGDADAKRELDLLLAGADVVFGFVPPADIINRAPKLKWLQATSAGVDRLTRSEIWDSNIIITGVSGIHATAISEFVLGTMLAFAKGTLQSFRNQQQHTWGRYTATGLHGRTVGIVGLGNIGREIARLSKAFRMRVIATRRSTRKTGTARNVDILIPQAELRTLLGESDYVVLSVPLTKETHNLIGAAELAAMKPDAYLINIARGGIVDEEALIAALKDRKIAGAGLDVTVKEPLPPESPLWDLENVILSPHVSGGMEDYMLRATGVFCDNLVRYRDGRRLRNLVKRSRGY